MKNTFFSLTVLGLIFSSCMKSRTCTCKDHSGKVVAAETKKTIKQKDIQEFEDNCNKAKIVETYGSPTGATTTYTTRCRLS